MPVSKLLRPELLGKRSFTVAQNVRRVDAPFSKPASRLGRLFGCAPSVKAVANPPITVSKFAFASPYAT